MDADSKEYTGFYKTKPAWMSNVNWCWHRADSELASGSYKNLRAENASEIGLEQSCAMKDGIEAVQAIRNKYSHQVSMLSPSEKEKLIKQYATTDSLLQFRKEFPRKN